MSTRHSYRSERFLSALLALFTLVGVCLIIAQIPGSPLRTPQTDTIALIWMPILIGVLAYFRSNPNAKWWEIVGLLVWSFVITNVVLFLMFFLVLDTSGGYPGATQEFINNFIQFAALSASFGLLYGTAGRWWAEKRTEAIVLVLSAPVVVFIVFTVLNVLVP